MARKREAQYFYNALDKGLAKLQRLVDEKPAKLVEDIDEEAKSIISSWYGKYNPIYYRNNMGLKKAYKILQNDVDVEIVYGPEYMETTYNQDTSIIFNNAFIKGYHGGSAGTDRNDETKTTPYWRTPFLHYTEWGYPAKRSFSPYKKIEKEAQKLMNDYEDSWIKELEGIMNPIRKSFRGYTRK